MIKGINIVLFVTSIFALVGVYGIKYRSETFAEERAVLVRAIDQQKARLSLLQADWAFVTQPSRIAPMVERHAQALGLEILRAKQFGAIEDLPFRPEIANDAALSALFAALETGFDPIGDSLGEILEQ